ncbi:MAG: Lipopolysaccharide-assembly [Pelagibacterales bacterium]|nr:Lipopolysaccharide-assembly [Pelagibacterales bacterium]
MKKNSILITLIVFFLISCGYKPVFLNKKNNFDIEKIEIVTSNRLGKSIKNSLNYISNKNSLKKINLLIDSQKTKNITSKDSKGNVQLLTMSLSVNVKIYENDEMKSERQFSESFSYSNDTNKFNLSQYEKNIERNLINNIIKNISIYLVSF